MRRLDIFWTIFSIFIRVSVTSHVGITSCEIQTLQNINVPNLINVMLILKFYVFASLRPDIDVDKSLPRLREHDFKYSALSKEYE